MAQNKVSAEDLSDIETNARRVSADDIADIEATAGAGPTPAPTPSATPRASSLDSLSGLSGQRPTSAAPELDAYIQSRSAPETPKAHPDPGVLSAIGNNLASGFLKQGWDEYAGAISRAKEVLPGAKYQMPDGTMRPIANNDELYRAHRDSYRQKLEGASEHYPKTSFVANMAGDLGSDALAAMAGVPVVSPAYQAASGALSGLMGSDAELTSDKITPGSAASAGASTVLGGALGFLAPKVGEALARRFPGLAAKVREQLEESAIAQGRRVLLNGADSLAGNKPLRDEAVKEALESGAISPLGTTQSAYAALEALAEKRGGAYSTILERLQELGVQGPEVEPIARELLEKADDAWRNSGADKAVANLYRAEAKNARNVAPRDFVLLGESPMAVPPTPSTSMTPRPGGGGPRPKDPVNGRFLPRSATPTPLEEVVPDAAPIFTPRPAPQPISPAPYAKPVPGPQSPRFVLEQAERLKRDLQNKARWERLQQTGLDEAKQDASQTYRSAIEDTIAEAGEAAPKGSEVAQLAEEFLPIKQQLSRTIGARDAAERGAAAAAKRRGISLTDYLSGIAAAGTGGPAGALLGAAGNNLLRNRGTSTFASGAYNASKVAGALGRWAATEPETARTLGQLGAGLMSRQTTSSDWLQKLVGSDPGALGEYGPVLASAMERGPEAFAARDHVLSQTSPDYRQKKEAAQKTATGQQ